MTSKNWRIIYFILAVFIFVYPLEAFAGAPLTLEQSIDIALKNSFILNIAKEGSRGAEAQKKEAFTGFLPKFSTSYNYTQLNEDPFSRFQGLPPGPLFGMNGLEIPVGTKNNYNWAIEAKQPLFAGGGILANYQASSIGENIARLEETAKYQDVVEEVKIAYFNILRAQSIQNVASQSVEMLKAHRDVAENYFKVGMIPKNDLLHAEVELANGIQAEVKAKNAVELAKSHFNTVLKRKIFEPVDVVDILTYHPYNQSFEECLNVAMQVRPEIKISSLKAAQAGKIVRVAQSDYFPMLSVVGNYTRFGDQPSVSGSDFKDMENWYVMAVASWNFWEWGKTKYRVDASKARENQAMQASKELNDQITLEIKNAYLILQETKSQIIVWQKVIEQAEENFRISEERYKERVATSTEVLDAQTLLTKAKSEYANALGDYNVNYAKLQRAVGIIWGTEGETLKESENNLKADKVDIKKSAEVNPNAQEVGSKAKDVILITTGNAVTDNEQTSSPDAQLNTPTITEKTVSDNNAQMTKNSSPEEDVRNLIDKWLNAWQTGDMKTYGNYYAADFHYKGKNLKDWISYKTKLHRKNKEISIRIEDLKILSDEKASNMKAVFNQYYNSSLLKDKVRKTLVLKNVNGEWKIFKETIDSRK